jgi:hypothetical protein
LPELLLVVAIIAAVFGGGYLLLRQNVNTILSNVGNSVNGTVPTATAGSARVSQQCKDQTSGLTDALQELDSRLSVGMNFSAYSDKVAAAKVAYDKLPVSALDATCLSLVGSPEETALNEYITAYNTWNDCVSDVDCKNDSITPTLQGHWSKATDLLNNIKKSLP